MQEKNLHTVGSDPDIDSATRHRNYRQALLL